MDGEGPAAKSNSNGPKLGCSVVALGLIFLFCSGSGGALYLWLERQRQHAPPSAPVAVLRPTPTVVVSMRQLALLQTVSFHLERVIDLRDKQNHFFGMVQSEDALLLVAAGDVTAGVDLSGMRDSDVVVDREGKRVQVLLPPARVLASTLDNDATYVHTRRTDALAKRQETLETRARQEAESSLRDAAVAGGILQRAREGAERTVGTLLRSLGFEVVEIRSREE
jgi:Protein of unknown function (DUF4230)